MDLPNELIKLVCSNADLSVYDLMALRHTRGGGVLRKYRVEGRCCEGEE